MSWNDAAIVVATFFGPIAAVQAQKYLERRREVERRKVDVFQSLMATRSARLSQDHVRALNSISLAFYGKPTKSGNPRRSREDQIVMDAWKEYHTHLKTDTPILPNTERGTKWLASSEELFLNLMVSIAQATRFQFARDELRAGSYIPDRYHENDGEILAIRKMLRELLEGKRMLPLDLKAVSAPDRSVPSQTPT